MKAKVYLTEVVTREVTVDIPNEVKSSEVEEYIEGYIHGYFNGSYDWKISDIIKDDTTIESITLEMFLTKIAPRLILRTLVVLGVSLGAFFLIRV